MSELGKKMDFSDGSLIEPQDGGCTLTCAVLCKAGAVTLCKCKNNKKANKGSPYFNKYNSHAASNREPTGGGKL